MKRTLPILLLIPTLIFTGCDGPAIVNKNNQYAAEHPTEICVMPDGRHLYTFSIETVQNNYHHIYYFGTNDTSTVSVNYSCNKHNNVIVVDGKNYQLVPLEK